MELMAYLTPTHYFHQAHLNPFVTKKLRDEKKIKYTCTSEREERALLFFLGFRELGGFYYLLLS